MFSQRRGVFTLHPSLSLTVGFYMIHELPGGRGRGGWGVVVKPGIDGDSNHFHPQPLSFTIIICPRLSAPKQFIPY